MRREKKGDDTMILTNPQDSILEKARLYQKELKASFPRRADSILQLVEALSSAEKPTSVVPMCQRSFPLLWK
jgi:hypothetical protein